MLFGNVGTRDRLDFVATGQAVAIVSRCDAMTRQLQAPILATDSLADAGLPAGRSMGLHAVRGLSEPIALTAFDPGAT